MFIAAAMPPPPFPLQQHQEVENQPPHHQQVQEEGQQQTVITSNLLLCQQSAEEEEESSAAVEETSVSVAESSSILTSEAPLQIQTILDHHLDTTAAVPAVSLSQPLSPQNNHGEPAATIAASSMVQHHQQSLLQKNMDADDVSASSSKEQQQQQQIMFGEASVLEVCVEESLQQQQQQSGAVEVLMRKSNLLSFNFETSLIRDELKLAAIIKSLPEYVGTKSEFELEYQGESIEGIFSAADKHHIRGQPIIDDINSNRLMRGLVYYVRELILSEDEDERETVIVLCWTDDAASRSEIYLERVSIDEYLRLLEDGYVLYYFYC